MKEVDRILDQLKRSFEGEAWYGPSVQEVLARVNAEKAAVHPIAAAHSIWEITQHIGAWQEYASFRLDGKPIEPTPEQDWPAVPSKTEEAWRETLQNLEKSYQRLSAAIGRLSDKDLETLYVPGKPYTLYFMLHGVIQHNLFHAGQISLLKKS